MLKIYVRLMDEGTEAFRPISVTSVSDGLYRIEGDHVPDYEQWEFQPGEMVRAQTIQTSSGATLCVAAAPEDSA
jgi:hypothetical protein